VENLIFPLYRPSFLFYLVCTPCTPMLGTVKRRNSIVSLDAVLDLQSKVDIYYAIVKEDTKQDLCNRLLDRVCA